MRNKKGDGSTINVVIWMIIAVIVLLFFLSIFNDKFKAFFLGTKCTGYCLENQADCTTRVTHEDSYCKKQTKGKWLYCCVDINYKGDPAANFKDGGEDGGGGGNTGGTKQIIVTDTEGNVVDKNLPVDFYVNEAKTLKFSYPDNKDCIVYVLDKSANPATKIPVINSGQKSVRFNCNAGTDISIKIPEEYENKELKLDMVVLKDSKVDSSIQSNWLASTGIPIYILPKPEIFSLNVPTLFEQYYDHDFQQVDMLRNTVYSGDKNYLQCDWEWVPKATGGQAMDVIEVQKCVYQITYDKTIRATQVEQFRFTVSTLNNEKQTEKIVTFEINYDAELFCNSKGGPEACDMAGCLWYERNNVCVPKVY